MVPAQVLVVEDDALARGALARTLGRLGYDVVGVCCVADALEVLETRLVDVVLTDLKMPGDDGLSLVRQAGERSPDVPCIVMTAYGSADSSVDALRAGAYWYLHKPFDADHEALSRLIGQAVSQRRLHSDNRALRRELRTLYGFEHIVGRSPGLRHVLDTVEKVADTDASVLIMGESGTGKELIARAIHLASGRSERNFVAVNCGAIPEELLESELFGHVRGAFTNAVSQREGRFARANGGTIFLDEIGDMSANLQVKMLRVLQDGCFERVGSSDPIEVSVRTIAATNQDLKAAMREGRFREDLYYRLYVVPIVVPPLRERRDDIPLLVEHFASQQTLPGGRRVEGFTPAALEKLMAHSWPGNVRELENLIERLAVLHGETRIDVAQLPAAFQSDAGRERVSAPRITDSGLSFQQVVGSFESDIILGALEHTGWNKSRAAQLLGLNRTTLLEMIKKKGLERGDRRPERTSRA